MTKKIKVAVLFGGCSDEYSVSLHSAAGVLRALDPQRYEMIQIGINEIYARHGRIFADPSWAAYFDGKDWYKGTVQPEEFDENIFSQTEKDNIYFFTAL